MNYQDFCGSDSVLPTPYIHVATKISKWEKYECIEINGLKFIRGYSTEKTDSKLFEYKEINDGIFFWDLMILYSKLSPKIFTHDQFASNAAITDNDINLIIHFCEQHGLPFWNKKLTTEPFSNISNEDFIGASPHPLDDVRNTLFRSIVPFSQNNLFPVPSFAFGLMYLRTDFLRIINYHGWEEYINILQILTSRDRISLKAIKRNNPHYEKISLYTPSFTKFETYWDSSLLSLRLNSENLFHLSIYQLCLYMQSGTFGNGIIKTCPKCHKQFIAKRKDQKYCYNPCTRQAVHMQKKRSDDNFKNK